VLKIFSIKNISIKTAFLWHFSYFFITFFGSKNIYPVVRSNRRENNSICLVPPRVELWAIGMGFVVLLFFIEIVNRLENEWKLKWQSLEGMLDQPQNSPIQVIHFRTKKYSKIWKFQYEFLQFFRGFKYRISL